MKKFAFYFLMFCTLSYAQTKYTIYDSQTKVPISYANVWKEKTLIVSSDSLGVFIIKDNDLKENFKISAIGYNDTIIKLVKNNFYLKPKLVILDNVKIIKRKNQKVEKIGKAERGDSEYGVQYDSKTPLCGKYFPNFKYETTFLDTVRFFAKTTSNSSVVNVVFYSVGENGEPKSILSTENKIIALKKGNHFVTVNTSDLNIEFPKRGIFVVIEHLLLEQNKNYRKPYYQNAFVYEPFISVNFCNDYKDTWYYNDDKWEKNNSFSINMEISTSN